MPPQAAGTEAGTNYCSCQRMADAILFKTNAAAGGRNRGMNVKGKKILIIGTGKSGLAAARLLLAVKAVPVLFDWNEKTDPEEVRKKLPEEAEVKILVGELPQEELEEISLAVFSPGVPVDTPFADRIREQGIPICGEVELGYAFLKGRLIAITGTN